jgi:DNA-binding helix-hairpin-helix protein with protein kinase domain
MSSLRHIFTQTGKHVVLGKELGKGGEGIVYQVDGEPDVAAKIYHQDGATERSEKLLAMVSANWHEASSYASFPIDALYGPSNRFVGFTMRKVSGQKPIHNLYSPTSRKTSFPRASFPFLLRTAANISRALASVHQTGCVVGDINQSGFLISDDATATMIDCDSFQVTVGHKSFLCKVGVPEFTPPELQGKHFNQIVRTPNHDAFGLAVLIFNLLFMGRHPFAGRFLRSGDMPMERAIVQFRFAYSARKLETQMEPPPNVPHLTDIPKSLANAFEIAFGQIGISKGRPTAAEWMRILSSVESEIVNCPNNSAHDYFRAASSCPWCRMEQAYPGFLAFVPSSVSSPSTPVNLTQLIAAIGATRDPGIAPPLAAAMPPFSPTPSPTAKSPTAIPWKRRYFASLGAFAAGLAAFRLIPEMPFVGGVISIASLVVGLKPSPDSPAKNVLARVQATWSSLENNWTRSAGNSTFIDCRRTAEGIARQIQALSSEEARRISELRSKMQEFQLRRFLERYQIENANIRGVGTARKATLRSFGIETAADVDRVKIERISGFGPTLAGAFVAWRNNIAQKFRFNPTEPINPADLATIKNDIARRFTGLEIQLRQAVTELQRLSASIQNIRLGLQNAAVPVWKALKQAELDARANADEKFPQRIAGFVAVATLALLAAVNTNYAPNSADTRKEPIDRSGSPPTPPTPGSKQDIAADRATPSETNQQNLPPAVSPIPNHTNSSATLPDGRSAELPPPSNDLPPLGPPIEIKPAPAPNSDNAQVAPSTDSVMANPTKSLNNQTDVIWIQTYLHEKGYSFTAPSGNWNPSSEEALADYKTMNKLPSGKGWDAATESNMLSGKAVDATRSFIGYWSDRPNCVVANGEDAPLVINARGAKSYGAMCEFRKVDPEGAASWQISATCRANGKQWNASIKMIREDDQLTWSTRTSVRRYFSCVQK